MYVRPLIACEKLFPFFSKSGNCFRAITLLKLLPLLIIAIPIISHSADKDLLIIAPWEIKSPDPSKSGYIYSRMQVIETLVDVDHHGNRIPGLATAWHTSDDGLQWTFTLREGVRFHYCSDLTAAEVVNALQIALQKPGMLTKAPIEKIVQAGNNIIIVLSRPYAILDSALTHYSAGILAPCAYKETGEVSFLIGTGPYRAVSLEPPQKLVVRAFAHYWGGATGYSFSAVSCRITQ